MKKKFVKPEIKSIRLRLRDNILAGSFGGNGNVNVGCRAVMQCKAGFSGISC